MKKSIPSFVLGIALLVTSAAVVAEEPREAEPRWGIRPESSVTSPIDLARWLARRLLGVDEPTPVTPVSPSWPAPGKAPAPAAPNEVCIPERVHCPVT